MKENSILLSWFYGMQSNLLCFWECYYYHFKKIIYISVFLSIYSNYFIDRVIYWQMKELQLLSRVECCEKWMHNNWVFVISYFYYENSCSQADLQLWTRWYLQSNLDLVVNPKPLWGIRKEFWVKAKIASSISFFLSAILGPSGSLALCSSTLCPHTFIREHRLYCN